MKTPEPDNRPGSSERPAGESHITYSTTIIIKTERSSPVHAEQGGQPPAPPPVNELYAKYPHLEPGLVLQPPAWLLNLPPKGRGLQWWNKCLEVYKVNPPTTPSPAAPDTGSVANPEATAGQTQRMEEAPPPPPQVAVDLEMHSEPPQVAVDLEMHSEPPAQPEAASFSGQSGTHGLPERNQETPSPPKKRAQRPFSPDITGYTLPPELQLADVSSKMQSPENEGNVGLSRQKVTELLGGRDFKLELKRCEQDAECAPYIQGIKRRKQVADLLGGRECQVEVSRCDEDASLASYFQQITVMSPLALEKGSEQQEMEVEEGPPIGPEMQIEQEWFGDGGIPSP